MGTLIARCVKRRWLIAIRRILCLVCPVKKCPVKMPKPGECRVVGRLTCYYNPVMCCKKKIYRAVVTCFKGRWIRLLRRIRCRRCIPPVKKCPAKLPKHGRCHVLRHVWCKYGPVTCCGKKIYTVMARCVKGRWRVSARKVVCRPCPPIKKCPGRFNKIPSRGRCYGRLMCKYGPVTCCGKKIYSRIAYCFKGRFIVAIRRISCRRCPTTVSCKCDTPRMGTAGHNRMSCSNGVRRSCASNEECYSKRRFLYGHWSKVCRKPIFRPDRRCNTSWKDQDGYGCDTYKKHQWCTASGQYGKNWNTWQFYKVNGKTALTCPQCGCKSNCDPNWKDAHGLSCSEYQKLKICTPQGGYGPGWANLTFSDFSDCYGRTAKVCPQCGCKEPRRYDWSSALKFKGRWTASGWEIARDKRNPRILVARTMNIIGNYGRAYLTVSFVVSRISCMKYSWRLHSEENYDFLSLYVNGVKKINITGHLQHWQSRQVQLSSGEKTLSWVYQKDSGYSSGTDRAWVVNIRLVRGKCLVPVIRPGKCDSSWKDQDGYGCDTYKKHQWCTASGQYGKN